MRETCAREQEIQTAPPPAVMAAPVISASVASGRANDVGAWRVLLINSNRFTQPWPVMPFGLCCVAASLEHAGHSVKVLDLCFSARPARDIRRAVAEFRPDLVGISVRNLDNCAVCKPLFLLDAVKRDVIEPVKKAFAGPVVIGGSAVGISAAEMLEFFDLEFAIRGDGEDAMLEFLRRFQNEFPSNATSRGAGFQSASGAAALRNGAPFASRDGVAALQDMPGLVWRRGGKTVCDHAPMRVPDLNKLPFARVHSFVDVRRYAAHNSPLQIQTKRGCALNCSYCTYNRIEGRRWRLRDPERIAVEIEQMVRETGVRHIEFTDSTFNYPLDHSKAVLRAIIARKLKLELRTMGLNPRAVDEELADLLKQAGFKDVDLGVESGSDVTLKGLGKNFTKDDVLRAGRLLRERGIATTWCLLLGGPGETPETLRETFATMNEAASPWDLVDIGIGLRVYNGSPVAERLVKRGGVAAGAADHFFRPVAYAPEGVDLEALKALTKAEALRRTNYFMYDEDEKTPLLAIRFGTWLLKKFAPSQPVWRLFIIIRKLQVYSGINALKRILFHLKSRKTLRRVSPDRRRGV